MPNGHMSGFKKKPGSMLYQYEFLVSKIFFHFVYSMKPEK